MWEIISQKTLEPLFSVQCYESVRRATTKQSLPFLSMGLLAKGKEESGTQCGAGLGSQLRGLLHVNPDVESCGQQQGNFLSLFVAVPQVFGEVQSPRTRLFCIKVSPAISPSSGGHSQQHPLELYMDMGFVTGETIRTWTCCAPGPFLWNDVKQDPREEGSKSPQGLFIWAVRGGTVSKAEDITLNQLLGTCRGTLRPVL